MADELKGTRRVNSANTPANAVSFLVESILNSKVNTMTPVVVMTVDERGYSQAAGRLTAKPLVNQRDADGNALPMAEMFDLPYMRYQGGKVAIVADPQPGDIGIAIYSQSDSSNVVEGTTEPVQPGSFRVFDQADGWYIGGFLNQPPETWIELTQDGIITVHSTQKIICESPDIEINGENSVSITAPTVNVTASTINLDGAMNSSGGNITATGAMTITGDVVSGRISLQTHTHGGVTPGGANTSTPN